MNFFCINFKQNCLSDLNTVRYMQSSAQKLVIFFLRRSDKKIEQKREKLPWQDDETTSVNKSGIYFLKKKQTRVDLLSHKFYYRVLTQDFFKMFFLLKIFYVS